MSRCGKKIPRQAQAPIPWRVLHNNLLRSPSARGIMPRRGEYRDRVRRSRVSEAGPSRAGHAEILVNLNFWHGGTGMNPKQVKCSRTRSWLIVLAVVFAAGIAGLRPAALLAKSDQADPQDKKEEKKDDKKEKKGLPLKPERKIEFTTDEGTWLSLDVSPDGKTIVFELLGDIYTLPIEGGEAKLIDGGMAFDSQPRFSPDGKWITFVSDREGSENVWIM